MAGLITRLFGISFIIGFWIAYDDMNIVLKVIVTIVLLVIGHYIVFVVDAFDRHSREKNEQFQKEKRKEAEQLQEEKRKEAEQLQKEAYKVTRRLSHWKDVYVYGELKNIENLGVPLNIENLEDVTGSLFKNVLNCYKGRLLNNAEIIKIYFDEANNYYKKNIYTLFWERIEKIGGILHEFDVAINNLVLCSNLIKNYSDSNKYKIINEVRKETTAADNLMDKVEEDLKTQIKNFSFKWDKTSRALTPYIPNFKDTLTDYNYGITPFLKKYEKIVLQGLGNHKFAVIYEQRAIQKSIVTGFKNLGDMVQNIGNQLNSTLTGIDNSIRTEAETSRERMSAEAETSRERMSAEAETSRERMSAEAETSRERMSEEAETSRERMSAEAETSRKRMSEEAEVTRLQTEQKSKN